VLFSPPTREDSGDDVDDADGDAGVGDVEGGPFVVPGAEVEEEFEEVDDGAGADAVDEVADGSGKDHGADDIDLAAFPVEVACPPEAEEEDGQCDESDDGIPGVAEEAEGDALILQVGDVEELVDHLGALPDEHVGLDPVLGRLIEQKEDGRDPPKDESRARQ